MPSKCDEYISRINESILPHIDYALLQQSYGSADKSYAKCVLHLLHTAMVEVYGGELLEANYNADIEDNYIVIPGVVHSRKTGQICLALLELDLTSSGEHWQTDFLCQYGVISQDGTGLTPELIAVIKRFVPYDYGYTAKIPCDIHVRHDQLPDGIKEMLGSFRNHTATLLPSSPPNAGHEQPPPAM